MIDTTTLGQSGPESNGKNPRVIMTEVLDHDPEVSEFKLLHSLQERSEPPYLFH